MSKKATIQFTAEHEAAKMFEEVLKRNGISDYESGYIDGVSVFHAENVKLEKESQLADEIRYLIMSLMNKQYDDKPDYAFILFIGTESGIEEYCNKRGYRSLDVGFSEEYGVYNPYLVGSNWIGDDSTPIPGTIVIPDNGITMLDKKTVTFREYMTFYKMPDGITEIDNNTFWDCMSLKSIEIPSSINRIGYHAFMGCLDLESLIIPNSVTKIEEGAFADCESLKTIELPSGITEIAKGLFMYCDEMTTVDIPDSVTKIGADAFSRCLSLTSIELPSGITEIGDESFACCNNLTDIRYKGTKQQWDNVKKGQYWFRYIGTKFIHCTDGDVELPCEVIDGTVYKECLIPLDKDYTIPDGVTEIAANAFIQCEMLTSIKIPNGVTKIGKSAFCFCTSLESVTLPNGLTDIDDTVFSRCVNLTSINMPASVTKIGTVVFYECIKLKEINYGSTIQQWNAVEKSDGWNDNSSIETVHCTDGDVKIVSKEADIKQPAVLSVYTNMK